VYDIGVIEGQHFLSMEYVDGEDLASLLRRIGRLPADKALEFARRICAGLAAAHERGVLHRDLKPANIMIDGRGQVRITDFRLAALAGDVHSGDIRSGTPAYMSPEQKAGKDVTMRSDIYALGLVLHEMFTGRRPGDSQATPTTLVKDLDPTIERVILRCLDADPRNRPSSALNVAMALPGGDPIAAALAAGETPSPEMVAASGEKEGLQPRTAIACFVGVVLMLVALVLLSSKTTLLGRAPLPLPPDALADRARVMLKQFGYTEEPVDEAYGFWPGPLASYQTYVGRYDFDHRWERLASHQPALTVFWYRQHQDYLGPSTFVWNMWGNFLGSLVTPDDPPLTSRGMVTIFLDANGRLVFFGAVPSRALIVSPAGRALAGQPMDWSGLLKAAGLDEARLLREPPSPGAFVPVNSHLRMLWKGSYGEARPDTITVRAAALEGRPVFFRIGGPWEAPAIAAQTRGGGGQSAML
jgi:serine/threonine-protein kinase